jgi:hypothetical protein
MRKKYGVRLTDAEREIVNSLVKKHGYRRKRCCAPGSCSRPMWMAPAGPMPRLLTRCDCRTHTIENMRERFVTDGCEIPLHGHPKRRVRGKILDGEQEAQIIALRLGPPPPGFANWTLRLLAEQAVTLDLVEAVSHETLRRTRKKTIARPGRSPIGSCRRMPMPRSPRAWRK